MANLWIAKSQVFGIEYVNVIEMQFHYGLRKSWHFYLRIDQYLSIDELCYI